MSRNQCPRTSNTGAVITSHPSLTLLVDWVQGTFKMEMDVLKIIDIMGLSDMDFLETKGNFGYPHCLRSNHIAFYFGAREDMGVHVELTGQGCREYEEYKKESWKDVFHKMLENGFSPSRLDIACDDFLPHFTIKQASNNVKKGFCTSRMKKARKIETIDIASGSIEGETLYFGQPTSRIQIRMYEKREERIAKGVDVEVDNWNRIEIQARNERALRIMEEVGSGSDVGLLFRGILHNYVQFRTPNKKDKNKTRWEYTKWYNNFLKDAEKIKMTEKVEEPTIDKKKKWIDEQVNKSLAMVWLAKGGKEETIATILNEGMEKIKDKDLELVNRYIKEKSLPDYQNENQRDIKK